MAQPDFGPGPIPRTRRLRLRPILITLALLVIVLAGAGTPQGAGVVAMLRSFLVYYAGVIALMALTATILVGVAATQHAAPIGFRILAQAAHRATAVMAVGFLVTHVVLQIMNANVGVMNAFLPFSAGVYIGLGTIAAYLLVLVLATGLSRRRFVDSARPWLWRAVHVLTYVMWPLAILHGVLAGRPPQAWMTWSFVLSVGLVVIGIGARLPRILRERDQARAVGAAGRRPTRSAGTARPPRTAAAGDLPDEQFWMSLRAETTGRPGRPR